VHVNKPKLKLKRKAGNADSHAYAGSTDTHALVHAMVIDLSFGFADSGKTLQSTIEHCT
jgi:hypothetical protein